MSGCQGEILMIISVVQVTGVDEIMSYRRKSICIHSCLGCTIKEELCLSQDITLCLFVVYCNNLCVQFLQYFTWDLLEI